MPCELACIVHLADDRHNVLLLPALSRVVMEGCRLPKLTVTNTLKI